MTKLFVALSALLLILVGVAAAKDSTDRDYLAQQQRYRTDHPGSEFDVKAQQLFPTFTQAKRGDTFRVERCISCHVPDIQIVGPQEAAKNLASDFLKYAPDERKVAEANHLTGVHPAFIDTDLYAKFGPDGFVPYSFNDSAGAKQEGKLPGFLPTFVDPAAKGGKLGIDAVGCITCHNGGRLALDEMHAHQNLIVNPEYAWSEGASLYYKYCAQCHGGQGEGGVGPPLSNQDRLGFFNEDYYFRCIEYGFTGFEHYGSIMPQWGSTASDFTYDPKRDKSKPPTKRVLRPDQVSLLEQFIRHWETYETLP